MFLVIDEKMRPCLYITTPDLQEIEMVEQDFVNEKKSAVREFEDHKIYLRDHLISELEEKQKMIETERHNMELTGDSFDLKPISTRKLRRRANEPTGKLEHFFVS